MCLQADTSNTMRATRSASLVLVDFNIRASVYTIVKPHTALLSPLYAISCKKKKKEYKIRLRSGDKDRFCCEENKVLFPGMICERDLNIFMAS